MRIYEKMCCEMNFIADVRWLGLTWTFSQYPELQVHDVICNIAQTSDITQTFITLKIYFYLPLISNDEATKHKTAHIWRQSMKKHSETCCDSKCQGWQLVNVDSDSKYCKWTMCVMLSAWPSTSIKHFFSAGNMRKIRPSGFTKYKNGWVKEGWETTTDQLPGGLNTFLEIITTLYWINFLTFCPCVHFIP